LNNIGTLLVYQSKFTEARLYLEKAISLYEKIYGINHHRLITILSNLATVMFHLRLFSQGREYYSRAVKICAEAKENYKECEDLKKLQNNNLLIGKKTNKKKKYK